MKEVNNTNESNTKTMVLTNNDCLTNNKVEFLEIKTEINFELREEQQIVKSEVIESNDEDSNKNDDTSEEERVTDFQIPKLEVILTENLSDEEVTSNLSKISKKSKERNHSEDETKKRKLKNKRNNALPNCKETILVLKDKKLSSRKHNSEDANSAINSGSVCEVPIKTEILFTDSIDFVNTPTNSKDINTSEYMNPNIDDPLDTAQPFTIDTSVFKAQPLKKLFKCKICGKSFHNKSTFRRHVWEHSQSFSCTYCTFKTDRKVQLNAHINTQHTKSVSYVCDYCGHTCYRKEYLIKHINSKHTKNIYYTCSFCSFKTCQKSYLSKHINIKHTHKVVYNCTYCNFSTCIKNSLKGHINAEHTKSISYKCSHCSYKTFYKSYYNKHVKARHRDKLN